MGDYRDLLREALGLQQAGKFADAAAHYRTVLAERPDEPNATYLLGVTLHQMGDAVTAIPLLERAVEQRPDFADAHNNLGEALRAAKRAEEAVARYERALELAPGHPAYLANLSHARLAARDPQGAIAAARAAIAAEPGLAAARQALGNALLVEGDIDGARAALEQALRLLPQFRDAAVNLAILEAKYGDAARAAALFEALPDDGAGNADSHAKALARAGRADAAQAVRLAAMAKAVSPAALAGESPTLFNANYDVFEPGPLWELHRHWGNALEAMVGAPAVAKRVRGSGGLRIGIVSSDFRRHSCAHFLLPLLEGLEPGRFALMAYSNVETPDAITARLKAKFGAWRNIRRLADSAAADAIRADGVDILVDLGGHTADNRLGVFARKPAPVQVSWLGYPNTTGLTRIDWRFTDAIADPPGADAFYSERLWRLEGGFLRFALFDDAPAPVRTAPGTGFRFGCFNMLDKISEPCWAAWCAILRGVPDATLLLKAFGFKDKATRAAWAARVASAGLSGRVRFEEFADDEAAHLARYGDVDLALDPAPYCGTTTSCEALWMGVPLVTLAGARHAARVGASLLARVADGGFVTGTWDEYCATAIGLARDSARQAGMAEGLAARARASALADCANFATEIGAAFEKMAA